jgi:myo-inositol-1(or 4)-monophosphatase
MLSNRPWDVSAGVPLVREAGGQIYDFDGAAYTSRSRFTIASASGLTDSITDLVRQAISETTAAESKPQVTH